MFEGCNVGTGRDFGGRIDMATAMTCKEGYWSAFGRTSYCNWARRVSPGSKRIKFSDVSEVSEGIESRSADDAQSDWFLIKCQHKDRKTEDYR